MVADDNNDVYGDLGFLAMRDKTVHDFRASEKDTKHKIIKKMLTLRHNMRYNKHLLSVYMRAKGLFDTMVEEHRSQLGHLDEIYRHLNNLIRENLSAQRNNNNNNNNNKNNNRYDSPAKSKMMMTELVKDKKRLGALLKKMRESFDKLMNVDTVIGATIEKINEITFMDEDAEQKDDEVDDEYEVEDEDEDEDEVDSDSEDEDDSDSEDEEEEDEDEEDEDDEDEEDEDDEDEEEHEVVEAEDDEEDEDDEDDDEDEDDEEDEDEAEVEDASEDASEDDDDAKKSKSFIYVF